MNRCPSRRNRDSSRHHAAAAALALSFAARDASAQGSATAPGSAQGATCAVSGTVASFPHARVVPADGVAPFELALYNVPVTASVTPGAATIPLRVTTAIHFDATAPAAEVRYFVGQPVDTASGVAHLEPALRLDEARWDGQAFAARALTIDGVELVGLRLPCGPVALGVHDASRPGTPSPSLSAPTTRVPASTSLAMRPSPGAPSTLELRAREATSLALRVLATRGAWTQVEYTFGNGSWVRGWVERSAVRRPTRAEMNASFGFGGLGMSGHGSGHGTPADVWTGEATVARGTQVFAEQGRGAWARVETDVPLRVWHRQGEAWAALEVVIGVEPLRTAGVHRAWVPFDTVRFPPHVQRRGGATARPGASSTGPAGRWVPVNEPLR